MEKRLWKLLCYAHFSKLKTHAIHLLWLDGYWTTADILNIFFFCWINDDILNIYSAKKSIVKRERNIKSWNMQTNISVVSVVWVDAGVVRKRDKYQIKREDRPSMQWRSVSNVVRVDEGVGWDDVVGLLWRHSLAHCCVVQSPER